MPARLPRSQKLLQVRRHLAYHRQQGNHAYPKFSPMLPAARLDSITPHLALPVFPSAQDVESLSPLLCAIEKIADPMPGRHPPIRCPVKNENYQRALLVSDTLQKRGTPLDWRALVQLQAALHNKPEDEITFRQNTAYSHRGQRHYHYSRAIEHLFYQRLSDLATATDAPVLKAISLYLDIIFFHPFADGNGRLARLGMDYILRCAALPGPDYAALMRIPKTPGDADSSLFFARAVLPNIISRHKTCLYRRKIDP